MSQNFIVGDYQPRITTADTLVVSSHGILHTITFSTNDAAPTAGTIVVFDNTVTGGTTLFSWAPTTAVFPPFSVHLDAEFTNGIYVDFTTTADVNVVFTYSQLP